MWRALTTLSRSRTPSNGGIFLSFQRALCCFPGFSNPGTTSRKGKIPKPLLAGVDSTGSSSTASSKSRLLDDSGGEASGGLIEYTAATRFKGTTSRLSDGRPEEMMLLEKQGRSSQRQRMQEGEQRRAGSLPPSSLPRPPRSLKVTTNSRYCRLSDSEARKKSDPGPIIESAIKGRDSGNCTLEYGRFDSKGQRRKKSSSSEASVQSNSLRKPSLTGQTSEYERLGEIQRKKQIVEVKHRENQGRSMIPPPSRRIGEYGRLSDGDGRGTLRKQIGSRGQSTGSTVSSKSGGRDSGGTASSEASTSSLPPTRARSIPRPGNYRIQF